MHAPADDALAGQTDAEDTASEPGDTAQSLAGRDVAGRTGTEQTATGHEGPSPTGTGTAAGGVAGGRAAATGQPVPGQAGAGHTGAGQADAGPHGSVQATEGEAAARQHEGPSPTGTGTAAGGEAGGRAAGAEGAATGQPVPGQADAGPHGSVQATEGEAAARQADAAPAAEGPVGAERTDAARAAVGQAAAEPTTAGQADAARAAGQQTDAGWAAEGQVGAGPTAAHQAAGRTAPVQAAGGWVSDGQAAPEAVPGAVPAYGSGVGPGGGWGPVETLGGGIPGYPVHPVAPPSRRGRRLRIGIAVAVAVAVLASIGLGVYALTDDGEGRSTATSQQPGGRDDGRDAPEEGGPDREGDGGGDEPRRVESGAVTDALSGISLPVPDGWYGEELQAGAALTSKTSYDCPGDTSKTCVKGGAYSAPAVVLGTRGDTAEEVAKADIAANAEESYGGEAYGRITSHDVLASKAVTVAGQKGYLVRWKAVTQEGSDGFVQSLAFPSPNRPDQIVVVRFGVDTDQQQKILDEITEGIEVAEGGRGKGQDV
ncbi:hypothetical protein [Streptomyces sp. I4(2020)]|uniref:hypothetical protein n=1 Tax=Streptomyces sp. I4(2020) TaxID=2760981 RepID=UPI0035A88F39